MFANCNTRERPYTSLRGPKRSGPNATMVKSLCYARHSGYDKDYVPYARTKIDVLKAMSRALVTPNWCAMSSDAGAIMEDDTGEMKVNADTVRAAAHFRFSVQLRACSATAQQRGR